MKTIAIDFDGVIAQYEGFKGYGIFNNPIDRPRIITTLMSLRNMGWRIIIYTARSETRTIAEWMEHYKIPFDFINHNPDNIKFYLSPCKPRADVYLDDRAINFDGDWAKVLDKVINFEPWWKK